jgi:oxygen-independent coproporphyrinogen-3 oxidase
MRTVRHRKPENFLSAVPRNGHGIGEEAVLSAQEGADEALVMGLRLTEGIDAEAIATRFGLGAIVNWPKVDRLVASGHLTRVGTRIAPTAAGRLLLDHILAEIAVASPTSGLPEQLPVSAAAA